MMSRRQSTSCPTHVAGRAWCMSPADDADDGQPRRFGSLGISTITSRMPLVEITIMTSFGPKAKLRRICSA